MPSSTVEKYWSYPVATERLQPLNQEVPLSCVEPAIKAACDPPPN